MADALEEWRARGRFIDATAGRVFVLDTPAQHDRGLDPVFVCHGFPSCSIDWRFVLPALSEERRVVLFDFIGFGLSDKPDRRYSIEMHADTASEVAAACGLKQVALVTHDMGDTVGGELLARDLDGTLPFAVTQRVLSNGSIYIEMAHLSVGQQLLLSLPDEATDLTNEEAFSGGLAETFSPSYPASAEELALQWRALSENGGHRLMPRSIRYIEDRRVNQARYTGAIEKHPSPLGVVWGQRDPIAIPAMVDRLLEARAGTPVVRLDDVGHYPMIEAPDVFAKAVLSQLP